MSLMDYLRKESAACILVGLTSSFLIGCNESRTELSDVLQDEAVVTQKKHIPKKDQLATGVALGVGINDIGSGVALGVAMSEHEKYSITFRGKKITLRLNDSTVFNRFDSSDVVDITYKEKYFSTYDSDGKLIKKELIGYKLISAEPKK